MSQRKIAFFGPKSDVLERIIFTHLIFFPKKIVILQLKLVEIWTESEKLGNFSEKLCIQIENILTKVDFFKFSVSKLDKKASVDVKCVEFPSFTEAFVVYTKQYTELHHHCSCGLVSMFSWIYLNTFSKARRGDRG